MQQIIIDRGLKSYELIDADGTVYATIRFNPSDIGIAGRAEQARKNIETIVKAAQLEDAAGILRLDHKIKHEFDFIFGNPVSYALFGGQSAITMLSDGTFLFEQVLQAIAPIVEDAAQKAAQASSERIKKHTAEYQDHDKGLAPEQTGAAQG